MTDIVYGIRITGEASGAKKAFEETAQAQKKLAGATSDSTSAAVAGARATERYASTVNRLRLAVLAAGAAALATFRASTNAAIEAERTQNRLTAVIKATGGAAGITRAQYDELAESLAGLTQFDDEGLREAQATLLKFGNIHGEVFRGALRLSADLAAFLGTGVPYAAQMLGKSLQSPTEGLMFMESQFGKLTDAEEKHISKLVEQGRAWETQVAVLALWEKKIGAAAQTMNTGLGKATSDVKKEWNELLETMGKSSTLMNRSLGGGASLLRDIRLTLEGTRNPLGDLANDTLKWLGYLKFVPGAIGMIGLAAERAAQAAARARRTSSGKINYTAQTEAFEAGLAAYAGPIVLGGSDEAAKREREKQKKLDEERASSQAADAMAYARVLGSQLLVMDEVVALSPEFLNAQRERRFGLEKEAEAVRDSLDPWNAYAREVERLKGLLDKGVISQREYGAAVAQEAKKVGGAFDEMADAGKQNFDELKQSIEGWGKDLSRELARGEVSIRSFLKLFEELLAMQINKRAVQPFLTAGSNFFSELFNTTGVQSERQMAEYQTAGAYTGNAAPFHGGRGPGELGTPRAVHPGLFRHAPRLHTGIGPGEMPAILRRDESVLTPGQMRAMGGGSLKINVINESGVPVQGQASAPRPDASGMVVDLVLRRLAVDGGARQQLRTQLSRPEH